MTSLLRLDTIDWILERRKARTVLEAYDGGDTRNLLWNTLVTVEFNGAWGQQSGGNGACHF